MVSTAVGSGVEDADLLRTRFSQAMSDMYTKEVPLYAELLSIVANVDAQVRLAHVRIEMEIYIAGIKGKTSPQA